MDAIDLDPDHRIFFRAERHHPILRILVAQVTEREHVFLRVVDDARLPVDQDVGQMRPLLLVMVDEHGNPGILGVRLKVVNRTVTEIETIVARRESANSVFPNPDGLKEKPIFSEDLPSDERLPRAKMIQIANGYFDTIQENTGKIYTSFDPDCARVENGVQTANNPNGTGVAKMGCEAQLKTGLLKFVTRCRDRRFVVVDQQKGLVLVSGFFDHAGVTNHIKLTDGTDYHVRLPFDRPYSFMLFELFKIKNAKIRQIEAVIQTVPYHMPTPWK